MRINSQFDFILVWGRSDLIFWFSAENVACKVVQFEKKKKNEVISRFKKKKIRFAHRIGI